MDMIILAESGYILVIFFSLDVSLIFFLSPPPPSFFFKDTYSSLNDMLP